MNKWIVLTLSTVGLVTILYWAINYSTDYHIHTDIQKSSVPYQENVKATGVSISETDKGMKVWEIKADQAVYNDAMGVAQLTGIKGKFLTKDHSTHIAFSAPRGLFNKTKKYLELTHGVHINAQSLNVFLTADKLIWRGTDDKLESIGHVVINYNNKAEIKGNKVKFPPNLTKFEIEGNTKLRMYR